MNNFYRPINAPIHPTRPGIRWGQALAKAAIIFAWFVIGIEAWARFRKVDDPILAAATALAFIVIVLAAGIPTGRRPL
jgi:hypothetical protein